MQREDKAEGKIRMNRKRSQWKCVFWYLYTELHFNGLK